MYIYLTNVDLKSLPKILVYISINRLNNSSNQENCTMTLIYEYFSHPSESYNIETIVLGFQITYSSKFNIKKMRDVPDYDTVRSKRN